MRKRMRRKGRNLKESERGREEEERGQRKEGREEEREEDERRRGGKRKEAAAGLLGVARHCVARSGVEAWRKKSAAEVPM